MKTSFVTPSKTFTRKRPASSSPQSAPSQATVDSVHTALTTFLSPPGGMLARRGTSDWLQAYAQSPWIRAIVSAIADGIASQTWEIFEPDETRSAGIQQRDGAGPYSPHSVIRSIPAWVDGKPTLAQLCAPGAIGPRSTPRRKQHPHFLTVNRQVGDISVEHPAYRLLRKPNPFMSGFDLRKLTTICLELAGNMFWLKERDNKGVVRELWPIPPHLLRLIPTLNTPFFWFAFWGRIIPIPRSEIVWFKDFDPANPYGQGISAAMALEDEAAADEKAAKLAARFFENDATPRLALMYNAQDMPQSQVRRIQDRWAEQFRGQWNAYKPAVVYGSLREIKVISSSMRDMEFRGLREFALEAHKTVWHVPGVLLGQMKDYNRANAEAALYMWALQVMAPRLVAFQQVVDRDVLSEFEGEHGECWMEHHDPVADDRERDSKIATKAVEDSILTVNEAREMHGKEPIDGGDVFRVPQGQGVFVFVKNLADVKPAAPAQQALPPAGGSASVPTTAPLAAVPEPDEEEEEEERHKKSARNAKRNHRAILRTMPRAELATYLLRTLVAHTEPLEEPFKQTLRKLFTAQQEHLHTRVEHHFEKKQKAFEIEQQDLAIEHHARIHTGLVYREREPGDESDDILGDRDDFISEGQDVFADAALPHLEEAADAGGAHAVKVVGRPRHRFDVQNPSTQQMLRERAQRFAVEINETTWDSLKKSLVEGLQKGETLSKLQDRISEVMDIARGSRTDNIARTEIVGVYNKGAVVGYRQGGATGKSWLTAEDDRVRDAHFDLGKTYDEAHPIPIDEPFRYDGDEADCPGDFADPSLTCRCRCTVLPETLKEDDGGDEEGENRAFNPDQPREPDGKWGSGGGSEASEGGVGSDDSENGPRESTVISELMKRMAEKGGFTYQPKLKTTPTVGYAVSPFPGSEKVINYKEFTRKDVLDYLRVNRDKFADTGIHVGCWHDKETGKVYLDISRVVATREEAETLARQHGQEAYYDLSAEDTVIVKDEGDRRRAFDRRYHGPA